MAMLDRSVVPWRFDSRRVVGMKAVRCKHGSVRAVEIEAPRGEGVLVDVASAGICGSDLHLIDGPFEVGVTLGHELAGTTPDGTAVAIEPLAPCGSCDMCRDGMYNLCRDGPAIILGIGIDGGMAEQILVQERALVPLAPSVSVADACLVEPLGVAAHGMRLAGVDRSHRVAIVGGGSIGQCAVAAARDVGAAVMLVARHDRQTEIGEQLGAVVNGQGEYDIVVDCAGSESALKRCLELVKPGGKLLLLASYWDGLALDGITLSMKEVTVIPASLYATHGGMRDIDAAAAILARQPALPELLITHRFPLDAATEAFAAAASRDKGAIKVVLEPGL